MPITRSKTAAERSTLLHEDFPASPSEPPCTATHIAHVPSPIVQPTHVSKDVPPHHTTTEQAGISERPARARSVRSQRSNASVLALVKQAEYEAEEELAKIKVKLIQKKLAARVAAIQEDTDRESVAADDTKHRVTDWLAQGERVNPGDLDRDLEARHSMRQRTEEPYRMNALNRGVTFEPTQRRRSPTPNRSRERGIQRLVDTIEKLALRRTPSRQSTDLPVFSGTLGEWLPFKASMEESTSLHRFSPAENIARLRACLRGEARQNVSALLFTATDPAVIMRSLEQCYGRPEMIIDQALEDIKKLPCLGTTASELNSFAIKLQNIVTVISCLDDRGYLQNPMLTRQVIDKLTPHIKSKWCDYAVDFSKPKEPAVVTLSHFLMREADRAMKYSYTAAAPKTIATSRPQEQPRVNDRKGKTVYATAEDEEKVKKPTQCFCCGAEHMTPQCNKLKAMSVDKRWEWAKEVRICFRCLNSKHRRFLCKKMSCGIAECRRPHHALLHADESTPEAEESVITAHASTDQNKVLLKVCPVTVKAKDGTEMDTYALLDEGSTVTLIDDQVAKMIGAQGPRRALNVIGVTSSNREPDSRMISMKIRGLNQESFHEISARTVKNLTLGSQSVEAELLQQAHLRHLKPELVCYAQAKPRILIGADNLHLIVTRKLLTGRRNQPAASLTRLGWIIHGFTPRITPSESQTVLHLRLPQEEQSEQDSKLNESAKAHYDKDALGVKRKPIATDERAKEIFEHIAKRVDGRFEVGLPWTMDHVVLPPSYDMALRRLRSVERKMDKSAEFKIAYNAQINKLLEKDYAEQCNKDHEDNDHLWYLPYFTVTNRNEPNQEGTLVAHAIERFPLIDLKRFPPDEHLVKAVAYVLAFIDQCRHRANELATKHLEEAERLLWREAQQECFLDDLKLAVELKNAFTDWLPALKYYATMKRIEWRFIDPGAPNQGGAWERLIKSVKSALAVTLKERARKEEAFNTLMTEIEYTVNSRPLAHVSVNPEDQEALTPNLGSATGLPYVGECDVADRRTWRASQALANMFWARWIKEYLPTLAPRNDVRRNPDNVKPGNLVIIADGLLPRNVWPRGLVERVYTGPDRVVRSAEVRTRDRIFKRPERRLVVLTIEKGCEDLRQGEDVADADP